MKYVAPFEAISREVAALGAVAVPSRSPAADIFTDHRVLHVLTRLIQSVEVDESWYRKRYPDVAEAIDGGIFLSAKAHFVDSGYREGRLPAEIVIDEDWYIAQYPDVADGLLDGLFNSAAEHFDLYGYQEGRMPFAL
jgi:hypothetical protein